MSKSIDDMFIEQFMADVEETYQRLCRAERRARFFRMLRALAPWYLAIFVAGIVFSFW